MRVFVTRFEVFEIEGSRVMLTGLAYRIKDGFGFRVRVRVRVRVRLRVGVRVRQVRYCQECLMH